MKSFTLTSVCALLLASSSAVLGAAVVQPTTSSAAAQASGTAAAAQSEMIMGLGPDGKPQYLVSGTNHSGVVMFGPEGQQYPAYSAWAKFIRKWHDSHGIRYRFQFGSWSYSSTVPQHPLESSSGLAFVKESQKLFGLSANWKCWLDKETNQWTFDISEVVGIAGAEQITSAVNQQLGLPEGTSNPVFPGV